VLDNAQTILGRALSKHERRLIAAGVSVD